MIFVVLTVLAILILVGIIPIGLYSKPDVQQPTSYISGNNDITNQPTTKANASNNPVDTIQSKNSISSRQNQLDSNRLMKINTVSENNGGLFDSLIDSSNVTFDEHFSPLASIKLLNKGNKEITQVIFQFAFIKNNEDRAMMRSLNKECYSYLSQNVNLLPGHSKTAYNFPIPQPSVKYSDQPFISVIKVRFADGSVANNDE